MPELMIKTRIQQKYKTLAEWAEETFIPLRGEVCYAVENDILYQKIGDGITPFQELKWLTTQSTGDSTQSDWQENDENSASYIKNRLCYEYTKEIPEEEQFLKTYESLLTMSMSKNDIAALINFADQLPQDIENYSVAQIQSGDTTSLTSPNEILDPDKVLAFDLENSFTKLTIEGNQIWSNKIEYIDGIGEMNFLLAGNPVMANVWLTLSSGEGTSLPLYDTNSHLKDDYCLLLMVDITTLQTYGCFIGNANLIDISETPTLTFRQTHEYNVVKPIDDKYLTSAQADQEEMDYEKTSYIYNKYGNTVVGTPENFVSSAMVGNPYIGTFTLGKKYVDGFRLLDNTTTSDLDLMLNKSLYYSDFDVLINGDLYPNCPIYYVKDFINDDPNKEVAIIGNPKLFTETYELYKTFDETLEIARMKDNNIPFVLMFDFSQTPSLIRFISNNFNKDDVIELIVAPKRVALATKVIPQSMMPLSMQTPWVYNESKESIMMPTAYEASGTASFAINQGSATGPRSFACGLETVAQGSASQACGVYSKALAQASFAGGLNSTINRNGNGAFAFGSNNVINNSLGVAFGGSNTINGSTSMVMGGFNIVNGDYCLSGSRYTFTDSDRSINFSQGAKLIDYFYDNIAFGNGIVTESAKKLTVTRPDAKTAIYTLNEGETPESFDLYNVCYSGTQANPSTIVRLSYHTTSANNPNQIQFNLEQELSISTTEIFVAVATTIYGSGSMSIGPGNMIYSNKTVAAGVGLTSDGMITQQFITGKYNAVDLDALFVVGNGSDFNNRSNAFVVNQYGTAKASDYIFKTFDNEGNEIEKAITDVDQKVESLDNSMITTDNRVLSLENTIASLLERIESLESLISTEEDNPTEE